MKLVMLLAMLVGTAVLYLLGTVWFVIVTGTGFGAALMLCVVPFLIGDALKMAMVLVLVPQLERVLAKAVPEAVNA